MKVCEICETEIMTRDGDNRCANCDHTDDGAPPPARDDAAKKKARREMRKARRDAMESLGLTRVRGALGGVYWE